MNRREFQSMVAGLLATGCMAGPASAGGKPRRPRSWPNLKMSTKGGQQLWGDVRYQGGHRIQRHALTGHHRLLNSSYERIAWGTLDACVAELETLRREMAVQDNQSTAVVFLHGLFRTRWSMSRIAHYVAAQTGWQPIVLGYPSTRGAIGDHAAMLADVVTHLEGVTKLHFVAHSLGNLVIRRWFNDLAGNKTRREQKIELGRMVMMGPPNHRPALARTLVPLDRHKVIAGRAGDELNGDWKELAPTLATPPCEFGILAGGRGDGTGHNPLIPGDDDMIVGVDETRLTGARDFRVLDVIHATMMDAPEIQQMATRFLKHGYFESSDSRTPLADTN